MLAIAQRLGEPKTKIVGKIKNDALFMQTRK